MSDEPASAARNARLNVGDGDAARQLRHELRTPINQIIGYSELLAEEAKDEGLDDLLGDLEKITLAARKLTVLVDEVLDQGVIRSTQRRRVSGVWRVPGAVSEGELREEAQSAAETLHGTLETLLVVDDNPENRDMLTRRLARSGYSVRSAVDGHEALQKIEEGMPDLVVLDVMMPGIDGFEVLERIRQDHDAAELPVIMATARTTSEDVVRGLQSGANDYVTKPLDYPVVLARIEAQLELKRIRDQSAQLTEELAGRNRLLRRIFGRYLSDEIVDNLLDSPESLNLGGERRQTTVLFADIRGFSDLAARLQPERVLAILNAYLQRMTEVIHRHGGTIDEIIGDGLLVLFGAPFQRSDDARRAIACAVEMQLAIPEVNAQIAADDLPYLEMGIAINTGELVLGNIGSEERTKYGVVGAPINQAARIEAMTVGGQVLAADSTVRAAGDGISLGENHKLSAKGLLEPLLVHSILGIGGEYQVYLPVFDDELRELPEPIRVLCSPLLEGKLSTKVTHQGELHRLSRHRAELRVEADLPLRRDVNLMFFGDDGNVRRGTACAKLTQKLDDASYLIHFTSLPPQLADLLGRALG